MRIVDRLLNRQEFNGKTYAKLIDRARRHIARQRNHRRSWEIRSYVNMMIAQSNHWVNDLGIVDVRDPNQLRRTVNKFRSTLRALKNTITYNAPLVDVLPGRGQEDIDQEELDVASYVCTNEYQKNHMRDLLRTVIEDAALKTFSVISILPNDDDDADYDDSIVYFCVHDPFDVFFDNKDMCKAQMVVVSSVESKRYLQQKGYVNLDKIQMAHDKSHSALKSEFERLEGEVVDNDMHLIDQVYFMDFEEDARGNIVVDGGKPKFNGVVQFAYCGDTMIKEPEILAGYKDLGDIFKIYYLERTQHITYGSPWMTDVVPLQRSLNDASENTDTILHWFCKVRLLQNDDAKNTIQMFEDGHVQKIAYTGAKPEFAEIPNVPEALFQQVSVREQQIEDMVGMHEASMGKLVASGASGRTQALVQASDMDNIAEPTSNLETFLEDVFARVLEVASQNVTRTMKFYGSNEDKEGVLAIGEKAYDSLQPGEKEKKGRPVRKIRMFHNVKVRVIPGSQFSVMQEKQELLDMLPILSQNGMKQEAEAMFTVILRLFATGGIRDIAKALKIKTKEEEQKNADIKIAEFEIVKLSRGEPVTATPEQNHEMHIQLKTIAMKNIASQYGKDADVVKTFLDNLQQHESMLKNPPTQLPPPGQAGPQEVTPPPPEAAPAAPPAGA